MRPNDVPPPEGNWRLFRGDGEPREPVMPPAPPWRRFTGVPRAEDQAEAASQSPPEPPPVPRYLISPKHADVVNAALHLRRPLLVTGSPGTGKSSLAWAVARELGLGDVLRWPINSRSTVQEALYRYDAVGRLRETALQREQGEYGPGIGSFVRLGPLGTALAPRSRPRILLIDELDKGDIDLPNDLLTVFEEGEFEIPELARLREEESAIDVATDHAGETTTVVRGNVRCTEFPVVVITSNGERDFPPAFLRRCVPLQLPTPDEEMLRAIVTAHLGAGVLAESEDLLESFLQRRAPGELATDQLLNAVFLRTSGADLSADDLLDSVLHQLGGTV
ncbi:AAA family ATPase [Streptomyces marispadix]|uniref:MoxR family ATPase n=1 Tax=Streptomyces marispadix TaxID=2922868 RepID=A0ABS9SUU7_9ACTN|nr:MoxR family ATPase [Streptomyces marispadix]MCH6160045.1 MoxR family ATPase [Streptomyces marispadix]